MNTLNNEALMALRQSHRALNDAIADELCEVDAPTRWVILCGGFGIKMSHLEVPSVVGLTAATVYLNKKTAETLAGRMRNGMRERARVENRLVALRTARDQLEQMLADILTK